MTFESCFVSDYTKIVREPLAIIERRAVTTEKIGSFIFSRIIFKGLGLRGFRPPKRISLKLIEIGREMDPRTLDTSALSSAILSAVVVERDFAMP